MDGGNYMMVQLSANKRTPWPPASPEGVVGGVSALAAPVLQLNAEAVVAVVRQQVERLVSQPVFPPGVAEAVAVVRPAAVKAHRAIAPLLEHRPGTA